MTDLLDRVIAPSGDLLDRVESVLIAGGIPDGHPVAVDLRRCGSLPADAVEYVRALDPGALRALGADATTAAEAARHASDALPTAPASQGVVSTAMKVEWESLTVRLRDGSGAGAGTGLAARCERTAAGCEDLAAWAEAARADLAGALAACLGSAEAVLVRSAGAAPSPQACAAAADIAHRVLRSVSETITAGWERYADWAELATPVAPHRAPEHHHRTGHHLELH